jgi:hypothetical protein
MKNIYVEDYIALGRWCCVNVSPHTLGKYPVLYRLPSVDSDLPSEQYSVWVAYSSCSVCQSFIIFLAVHSTEDPIVI